jgi:hypothetical protein
MILSRSINTAYSITKCSDLFVCDFPRLGDQDLVDLALRSGLKALRELVVVDERFLVDVSQRA